MKKDEFLHCLRILIVPGFYERERIDNITEFCLKYGFKNVMLFINSELYNVGHMTIEEARPWVETIKRAKEKLNANGITVSLNPWMEIGHLDRARSLKEEQNFTLMVDYDGNESKTVVCPLCNNWRKYFAEFYRYLLTEIEPDTLWVEDDFRLHNHDDLKYGGCFCSLHMAEYNKKLGSSYTREEFTDKLFRKKCDESIKCAWLDVSRETMNDLAEFLGKTISEVGKDVKVGLMSSTPQAHAVEGRDWFAVHNGLSQGGELINRVHLPCYNEIGGKKYYFYFNCVSYLLRGLLPEETKIYPELENGSFSTFTKEARFLRFQLESAIPLCIKGMTYNIFDYAGNGTIENYRYGEEIKYITAYLNGVTALHLKYSNLIGVILPIEEKTVYNRTEIHDFNDFYPDEFMFYAYLTSLGISCKPSKEKSFKGNIVALSNGAVNNFSNEQLIALFNDNKVIAEGGAVELLVKRNLGFLIGAKGCRRMVAEHDVHSYEQVASEVIICRVKGYRASVFGRAGDYVNIEYSDEVDVKTAVFDYNNKEVGKGIVLYKNTYIVPYVIKEDKWFKFYDNLFEQYNNLRTYFLYEWIGKSLEGACVLTGHEGIYSYLYGSRNVKTLILVNSTEQSFEKTEFITIGMKIKSISRIDKKSGEITETAFSIKNNKVVLELAFEYLSTHTLLLTEL